VGRAAVRETVEGVPGAFVVRGVLTEPETGRLAAVVRAAHEQRALGTQDPASQAQPRRDSQHNIPLDLPPAALSSLGARMRACLPPVAGPPGGCRARLAPAGSELSGFLRCYHYHMGDESKPHFDRSFREHAAPSAEALALGGRGAARPPLKRFSAFSVLLYLNDDFEVSLPQHDCAAMAATGT
jgi:hypothetical protein